MNRIKTQKLYLASIVLLLCHTILYGQSPYSLSPDWYFGQGGRLTFPNGNFPTSTAPTSSSTSTNNSVGVEASTSICFSDGTVALYTNTMQAYNGGASGSWNNYIRNFINDNTCAGSSTGGGVAFPDPASPTDAFYLILGNDLTSGGCDNGSTTPGVNRYRFTGTGPNVTFNTGPVLMASYSFASEAITAGTDGAGGYYVVIHDKSSSNTFRVWHFTSSGISGPNDYTIGANVTATDGNLSYLKISPCQDKIAYHSGGILVVHNWDRTTGIVGSELRRISPADHGVGLEFSPDGSKVYYSGEGSVVSYVDIATGTTGTISGSTSWSMQLGPDGKIYTSPGGTSLGVIQDPNNPTTTSYGTIALGAGASTYRGLINVAWLNPNSPVINNNSISSCDASFSYLFQNYFNTNIPVDNNSIVWNFGDGGTSTSPSPTHTYAANGDYTIKLKINDATCGHTFTDSLKVSITNCASAPPPSCTYNINAAINPISDINLDNTNPVTVNFDGTISTFDASGTEPYQYYWMNGSPDTNTAFYKNATSSLDFKNNGTGNYLPQGTYTVYLVIREGICLDTATVTFNVIHQPDCPYNIDAKIDAVKEIMIDENSIISTTFSGTNSIFDNSGSDPQKYFWMIDSPDTLTSFSNNPVSSRNFAFRGKGGNLSEGQYDIYLVIQEGKCLDTAHVTLNVTHFFIPNLVTPNHDALNDKFEITNTPGRFDVEIYNRWGERVYAEKGYTGGWDTNKESDDIYFYHITDTETGKKYKGWVQVISKN